MLVNIFIFYETYLLRKSVSKNNILSEHEFRKAIALAWIDPQTYWKSNNRKCTNDEANKNITRNTRSIKRPKEKKAMHIADG